MLDFLNLPNPFGVYQNVETPKVTLDLPLMDNPLDISDWAYKTTENGTPIVKSNIEGPKMIIDNTEEVNPIVLENISSILENSTPNQNLNGKKKLAMEFFMSKKDKNGKPILSEHLAAGLVGNLLRESGLNPLALNKASGAMGIALWLGGRKKKLISKYGKNPSFEQQLEFVWEELNSTHKKGLDSLRNSLSVDEAAANAFGWYEFSVGPQNAIAEMKKYGLDGLKSYNQGIKFAKSLIS